MPRSPLHPFSAGTPVRSHWAAFGFMVGTVFSCAHVPAEGDAATPPPAAEDALDGEVAVRPHEDIATVLQGRFSGVNVSVNTDGSLIVRIHGVSSFYGSTVPLYVVDGTPFQTGPDGSLSGINPHDVQSIKVLKYPPETSLYGVRGANGVVLITTRRPRG